MPAPVPTPSGVVRCITKWASGDAFGSSRFDLAYTGGPPTTAVLGNIATLVSDAVTTHLVPWLSAGGDFIGAECIDLANPDTPAGSVTVSVGGGLSGTPGPTQAMMLINKIPDRRYRGGKPKQFLPLGNESVMSDPRTWTSGFQADVTAAYEAMIAELSGASTGGVTLGAEVCVSYYSGTEANPNPRGRLQRVPTPRVVPLVVNIESIAAAALFGTQRRRVRGN